MKRVKRFGVYQTAKISAIIYFIISALFMVPFGLFFSTIGGGAYDSMPFFGGMFFFLLPFFYAFIGFVFTALGCVIYNMIAKYAGGIEMEIETIEE